MRGNMYPFQVLFLKQLDTQYPDFFLLSTSCLGDGKKWNCSLAPRDKRLKLRLTQPPYHSGLLHEREVNFILFKLLYCELL